jgi:O-antigen ligase
VRQPDANTALESPDQTPTAAYTYVPRWSLSFIGILGYAIFEYTRLPQMFPILQGLQVGKFIVAVAALGLVLSPMHRGDNSLPRRIDLALFLFLAVSFVSIFFADYPSSAWPTFIDAIKWAVVYFLVGRIVSTSWRLRVFSFAFLLLNLKLAQFAVRTYLTYGTVSYEGGSIAMVAAGTSDFFGNTNDFGVAMCVVWPMAGALLYGEKKTLAKIFLFTSFVGIFLALLLSGCRGAFLGACAAVVAGSILTRKMLPVLVMGGCMLLGTFFLLPSANRQRLQSAVDYDTDSTAHLRIGFWKAGLRMFRDHPVIGVGPGNFGPQYRDKYFGSDPFPKLWAPHSIYIQPLAETGILGTIPIFALFWMAFRLNSHTRKVLREAGLNNHHVFEYRLALGLELSIIAYLVSGATLTVLYYPHLWFLLGLSVGLYRMATGQQFAGREVKNEVAENSFAFAKS